MFNKRFLKRFLNIGLGVLGVLTALVAVSIVSGVPSDVSMAVDEHTTLEYEIYDGLASLEETIVYADVIAVVNLVSVSRGVEKHSRGEKNGEFYETGYSKTLEYTFEVEQYLKGEGKDQVVGIVFSEVAFYNTAAGALMGITPDEERKDYWDNRKAVVFLRDTPA